MAWWLNLNEWLLLYCCFDASLRGCGQTCICYLSCTPHVEMQSTVACEMLTVRHLARTGWRHELECFRRFRGELDTKSQSESSIWKLLSRESSKVEICALSWPTRVQGPRDGHSLQKKRHLRHQKISHDASITKCRMLHIIHYASCHISQIITSIAIVVSTLLQHVEFVQTATKEAAHCIPVAYISISISMHS